MSERETGHGSHSVCSPGKTVDHRLCPLPVCRRTQLEHCAATACARSSGHGGAIKIANRIEDKGSHRARDVYSTLEGIEAGTGPSPAGPLAELPHRGPVL